MSVSRSSKHDRILALAERLIWWKSPTDAVAFEDRLLAQVMTFGTWDDIMEARCFWPESRFREALQGAPAGVFDPRSWAYWHVVLDLLPVPPLPQRNLPEN
ncbi:MAG: hypothetical protein ABI946_03985 [Chthoniobacterales bacterium]